MVYLRTPAEIKSELAKLFIEPGEKWAIVAFVGYSALDQLPKPIGDLSVVCWPKAGATHPDGVRRLLAAGVRVFFCADLHSKIFWRRNCGLIVGSANLSNNALGKTNQHEFAVYVADNSFEIQSVLKHLSYAEVTQASLHNLDMAHVAAATRDLDSDEGQKQRTLSFSQSRAVPIPKKWKFISSSEERVDSATIREAVIEHCGKKKWANDNDAGDGIYQPGDFVFQIHLDDEDDGPIKRANGKWLRVDFIAKQGNSPVLVQVHPLQNGPNPPFEIDATFKRAFKQVFNESTWEEVMDDAGFVQDKFIRRLELAIEAT